MDVPLFKSENYELISKFKPDVINMEIKLI
jgi:hypothetical protein